MSKTAFLIAAMAQFYTIFIVILAYGFVLRAVLVRYRLIHSHHTINIFVLLSPMLAYAVLAFTPLLSQDLSSMLAFAAIIFSSVLVYYFNEGSDTKNLKYRK